jgi:hypothetical protein
VAASGAQFDPDVVTVLVDREEDLRRIHEEFNLAGRGGVTPA